jgi:hypothetical protein
MDIIESLTFGEIEEVETLMGRPIDEIHQAGQVKGKAYAALVFVVGKRTNPALTMEAVKAMTMNEGLELLKVDTDPK